MIETVQWSRFLLIVCVVVIIMLSYQKVFGMDRPPQPNQPATQEETALPQEQVAPPVTKGWVEYVWLFPDKHQLKAKLDTGARTSSIHADVHEEFEKDGKTYVRFTVNADGQSIPLTRRVVRMVRIKNHDGPSDRRYVVNLAFCIGQVYYRGEVTLANRDNFIYPILIGRNFLSHRIAVDAGQRYTSEPSCISQAAVSRS